MDAEKLLTGRRSVRKYNKKPVTREVINEIMELTKYAPSWANFQIARYTFVDDAEKLEVIADSCVKGFTYNANTIKSATGVAVLSFVKGKSGILGDDSSNVANGYSWETFDAGIACQTFCLSAYAKGVGTCIFGVIDSEAIAKAVKLPENETVAALIAYGYPEEEVPATPRKSVDEISRFA